MDFQNRIIKWIEDIYGFLSEEYLISLSNKGIYNRGKKDLEKCEASLKCTLKEDCLSIALEGEVSVCINKNLQESTCTCPAQNVCRHKMTAFLYCKKIYEDKKQEMTVEETQIENTQKVKKEEQLKLQELEALTTKELIKYFGKKIYQEGVRQFDILEDIQIEYGKVLTFTKAGMFTVYLTQEKTLEHALCSCKEKGPCIHKFYAVAAYLKKIGKDDLMPIEEVFEIKDAQIACLQAIQKEMSLLMDKGLSSITQKNMRTIEKYYIKAYNYKFYKLAEELKALSSELVYYFSRNVGFSTKKTMQLIARIYNRCEALQLHHTPKRMSVLVGKLKEESKEYPVLHLWGLGARSFISRRKELVMSVYFYCKETKGIVSMTTLRPISEQKVKQGINVLVTESFVWEEGYSFQQLMHSEIVLKQGQIKEGKLSSSKKSQGIIQGRTTLEAIKDFAQSDYGEILQQLNEQKPHYFEGDKFNQSIYLIRAHTLSHFVFNQTTQNLEAVATDQVGREIYLYIPYHMINESWIEHLELCEENTYQYLVCAVTYKKGYLQAELLSIVEHTEGE